MDYVEEHAMHQFECLDVVSTNSQEKDDSNHGDEEKIRS